jgi:hypothetical protein
MLLLLASRMNSSSLSLSCLQQAQQHCMHAWFNNNAETATIYLNPPRESRPLLNPKHSIRMQCASVRPSSGNPQMRSTHPHLIWDLNNNVCPCAIRCTPWECSPNATTAKEEKLGFENQQDSRASFLPSGIVLVAAACRLVSAGCRTLGSRQWVGDRSRSPSTPFPPALLPVFSRKMPNTCGTFLGTRWEEEAGEDLLRLIF